MVPRQEQNIYRYSRKLGFASGSWGSLGFDSVLTRCTTAPRWCLRVGWEELRRVFIFFIHIFFRESGFPSTWKSAFNSGRWCVAKRQLRSGRQHFGGARTSHISNVHPQRGAHAAVLGPLACSDPLCAPHSTRERDGARWPAIRATNPRSHRI